MLSRKALLECRLRGIASRLADVYEKATARSSLRGAAELVSSRRLRQDPRTEIIKRSSTSARRSRAYSVLAIMVAAAIAIRLESPGPILYRQPPGPERLRVHPQQVPVQRQDAEKDTGPVWPFSRTGASPEWGRSFDGRGSTSSRSCSTCSRPHSFIGPRPERPEFVADAKQIPTTGAARREAGITGWHKSSTVRFLVEDAVEKLQYDLYYIKNLSLFLDLLIALNTIQVVLFARGRERAKPETRQGDKR